MSVPSAGPILPPAGSGHGDHCQPRLCNGAHSRTCLMFQHAVIVTRTQETIAETNHTRQLLSLHSLLYLSRLVFVPLSKMHVNWFSFFVKMRSPFIQAWVSKYWRTKTVQSVSNRETFPVNFLSGNQIVSRQLQFEYTWKQSLKLSRSIFNHS